MTPEERSFAMFKEKLDKLAARHNTTPKVIASILTDTDYDNDWRTPNGNIADFMTRIHTITKPARNASHMTRAETEMIGTRYRNGEAMTSIAIDYGVTACKIRWCLVRSGVALRRNHTRVPDEVRKRVLSQIRAKLEASV